MQNKTRSINFAWILSLFILLAGCPLDRTNDHDPMRCNPACAEGLYCYAGSCTSPDASIDGAVTPKPDQTVPDAPKPDAPREDAPKPDTILPDTTFDLPADTTVDLPPDTTVDLPTDTTADATFDAPLLQNGKPLLILSAISQNIVGATADSNDNLYFVEELPGGVYRVAAGGGPVTQLIAGGFMHFGSGTSEIDIAGSFIYFVETKNNALHRVPLNGPFPIPGEGLTPFAQLSGLNASGLTHDSQGNLYLSQLSYPPATSTILKVDAAGTVVGPTGATFVGIWGGIRMDDQDNLYIAAESQVIRVSPTGATTNVIPSVDEARGIFYTNGFLYVTDSSSLYRYNLSNGATIVLADISTLSPFEPPRVVVDSAGTIWLFTKKDLYKVVFTP
jgi:sugar lactone lactonase YvrE